MFLIPLILNCLPLLLPTRSEEREVLGVGSIPVEILLLTKCEKSCIIA